MELNRVERLILTGLLAREREVNEKHVLPLRADFAEALGLIEERLGLERGAINTTHAFDFDAMTVVPLAPAGEAPDNIREFPQE
jgi:hypothetical protein